jgi:Ca2+-binding RTX toxin-like protein
VFRRVLNSAGVVIGLLALVVFAGQTPARSSSADIRGTPARDLLYGTAHADRLLGLGGADDLYGRAGDDFADGGGGPDFLNMGHGNDRAIDLAGGNVLYGGNGADVLRTAPGRSEGTRLIGGRGNDTLRYESRQARSADFLAGRGHDHVFVARAKADVSLGPGNDYVMLQSDGSKDRVDCGPGRDRVEYSATIDEGDVHIDCERIRPSRDSRE